MAGQPSAVCRCVVFDYDGTLADSNRIKREAWFGVFARLGCDRAETAALLGEHPTADRYELIGVMLDALAGQARLPAGDRGELAADLARSYNDLCEDGQATCPEMPGAGDLLRTLALRMPLYVNSATPQEPLRRIVARRGWEGLFRGVFGRPHDKADILRYILAREGLAAVEVVMVGDGPADWQAAQAVGCPFFAVGELRETPFGQRLGQLGDLPAMIIRNPQSHL